MNVSDDRVGSLERRFALRGLWGSTVALGVVPGQRANDPACVPDGKVGTLQTPTCIPN